MRSRFATSPLLSPLAQPSTMRARIARACPVFGRPAIMVSFSFSSGVTLSGLVGRPMAIRKYVPAREIIQHISNSGH